MARFILDIANLSEREIDEVMASVVDKKLSINNYIK